MEIIAFRSFASIGGNKSSITGCGFPGKNKKESTINFFAIKLWDVDEAKKLSIDKIRTVINLKNEGYFQD
jgi:hypothetical protein